MHKIVVAQGNKLLVFSSCCLVNNVFHPRPVIVGFYGLKINFQIPFVVRPILVNGAIRGRAKTYRMAVHAPLAILPDCGIPIRSPLCQPLEGAFLKPAHSPGAVPVPGFYRLFSCHAFSFAPVRGLQGFPRTVLYTARLTRAPKVVLFAQPQVPDTTRRAGSWPPRAAVTGAKFQGT
jgi:hypothetical protein